MYIYIYIYTLSFSEHSLTSPFVVVFLHKAPTAAHLHRRNVQKSSSDFSVPPLTLCFLLFVHSCLLQPRHLLHRRKVQIAPTNHSLAAAALATADTHADTAAAAAAHSTALHFAAAAATHATVAAIDDHAASRVVPYAAAAAASTVSASVAS